MKQETVFADSKLVDIMAECVNSTKATCELLFQERFYEAFTPLHDQIFDLIDSGHQKIVIAAPRGIGKTSIVGLGLTARNILLRLKKFIVYVSNSATSAELQTENLKHELMSNRVVREIYGSLKVKRPDGMDDSFSKKAWVSAPLISRETGEIVQDGTLVLPRGSGQQVRGILYHNARPDLIIIDDLEDKDTIDNEEQREKRKIWFFGDLLKCVSRLDKDYQIVYIDTLKHHDALLQTLMDADEWLSVRLEICDDNRKSNAPSFMSDAEIEADYQAHKAKGLLDVFYQENRNIPTSKEDAVFRPEMFRYYREELNDLRIMDEPIKGLEPRKFVDTVEKVSIDDILNVVIVDPAKTVKLSSADSAVVGIGIDRTSRKIFIRDIVSGKFEPSELIEHMFNMVYRLKAFHLGVEVTSLHQWVSQPIENEMRVRGVTVQYHELQAVGKKIERIKHLGPFYNMHYIYHNVANHKKLETQLETFPKSVLMDIMDAEAYIVKLLDIIDVYFDPPDIDQGDPEDEFKELKNDDALDYPLIRGIS